MSDLKLFSVWVGGAEINSNYLTGREAIQIAEQWISQGYEDVAVERVLDGEGVSNA